jgi:hypothetical protein
MITTRIAVSRTSSGGIRPNSGRYTDSSAGSMATVLAKTPSPRDVTRRTIQRDLG